MIVLQTKLNRPSVTRNLVVRPRLLAQLNAGLEGAMTLVIAPAGFGKTTLVSSWLEGANGGKALALPYSWLTLDEGDSERDVFLQYFIAALQIIFPEACTETLKLLRPRHQVPTRVLLNTLSNEIEALPSRFVIVMDDLHAPDGRAIFETLNDWLQHWPRQMHLVLLSRYNPPLPLTSLRAKGLLTEIRSRDLRFTRAEVTEYFDHAPNLPLDEPAITLLQEWLEGWIAGLKMASLYLGERKSVDDLAAALRDNDVFITDYLVEEVVASQPPQVQRFLLKTSIVDQLSASLAETLMDDLDAGWDVRDCLDHIRTADLFLTPLGQQSEWYRYHRIFRDALRQKLSTVMPPAQIADMHVRAAGWFFAHGLPDQAIHHALEAGDLKLAAAYMEQGLCDVLNREDRSVLERWLRMLPEAFIAQSPWLLIMRATLHSIRWESDLATRAVQATEALLDPDDHSERMQILLGLIDVARAQAFYHASQYDQAVTRCGEALARLPAEWRFARGAAAVYMGVSLYASGHPEAAQRFLIGQYELCPDKNDGYALRILLALATNYIQAGDYENAERTARTILQHANQSRLLLMQGWGYYLLGFVNYEWNELARAAEYFGRVTDLFFTTQLAVARNGLIAQAYIAQVQGRPAEARQIIDRLSGIDLGAHGQELMDTTSARCRLLLMGGNMEAAEPWIHLDTLRFQDQTLPIWMEQTSLTRVRVLLARNKGADNQVALQILDTIGQLAERTLSVRITIEVLALRSLALLGLGDHPGARDTLIRSVELARRGLFTRTYVDLGPPMQQLLSQIAGHASVSKSVGRILAAFPASDAGAGPAALGSRLPPATQPAGSDDGELDERLTQRELEILLLMAEPISFRDVASRMNISYTTARRYTINVYSKFGVHSRWEAVNCAIRKGIIAPR